MKGCQRVGWGSCANLMSQPLWPNPSLMSESLSNPTDALQAGAFCSLCEQYLFPEAQLCAVIEGKPYHADCAAREGLNPKGPEYL